jgi:thioredoxin-like negative regulator of GroEL
MSETMEEAERAFADGEVRRAAALWDEVLQRAAERGDVALTVAALRRRIEAARWLGDPREAHTLRTELALLLEENGRPGEAARLHAVNERYPDGEPLLRVVAEVAFTDAAGEPAAAVPEAMARGGRLELDDLEDLQANQPRDDLRVRFWFERNRPTLPLTERLAAEATALAEEGRYLDALTRYEAAERADPHDPHPRYLAGLTLLYLKRYAEAELRYAEVERLAPGWFQSRADRALAGALAAGELAHAAWHAFTMLEDGGLPPRERLELARKVLADAPRFGQPHLAEGRALLLLGQPDEAERAFRRGVRVADEPDVRSRLLFELGALVENDTERAQFLEEAQLLPGNLIAAAMARFLLGYGVSGESR